MIMTNSLMTDKTFFEGVLQGYIAAALWAEQDDNDNYLDSMFYVCDLLDKEDFRTIATKAISNFIADNYNIVSTVYYDLGVPANQIGHDLWLTRNHHGAGFWDSPELYTEELGRKLTEAANSLGQQSLYLGDDGQVYFEHDERRK